ncbi:TVP38/TMEM64 family inner membrane protein YdjZ [compost metagenome]
MNSAVINAVASFAGWADSAGTCGVAIFALGFVCATLAFVPASPFTAVAGFLFGPVWGAVLISPLGVLVAALAFFVGRTVARPWVQRKVSRRPRLAALDAAIGGNGLRIVFLLRLASVIPFAPLNYALGASKVCSRDYVLASWLGLLPGTILYVYLGSLMSNVAEISGGHGSGAHTFFLIGLVVAATTTVVLGRVARTALNTAIEQQSRH